MAFSNRSFDYSSKQLIPCVVMDGPPTERTNGAIGALCINKDSGSLYKCVAANYCDNVFTWKIVGEVSNDTIRQSVSDFLAQNPVNGGLSDEEKDMILTLFRGAVYQSETTEETTAAYSYLQKLWGNTDNPNATPDVTLTNISAVYSGGDVAVGTAVTDLTGIVVTAHFSDGTSETVTGYILSGTIAEGSNTVTVSYEGKTTTFTVTGVAEGSETVVEMTCHTDNMLWETSTYYSDGGDTEFSGSKGPSSGKMWYSDVFEQDTTVTIAVKYGSTNSALKQYCGCLAGDDVISNVMNVYYFEQIGAASTEEYTVQYTVRAGYRLMIQNYNSGVPQSIVVTR